MVAGAVDDVKARDWLRALTAFEAWRLRSILYNQQRGACVDVDVVKRAGERKNKNQSIENWEMFSD